MRKLRFQEAKNMAHAHKASEYRPGTQFRAQLLPIPTLFGGWGLCVVNCLKLCSGACSQTGRSGQSLAEPGGYTESGIPHPWDEQMGAESWALRGLRLEAI